ncbi:MAG: hypothetical protein Q8L29_02405 [archaeon]|nr:hypothetical protein [archaeon]
MNKKILVISAFAILLLGMTFISAEDNSTTPTTSPVPVSAITNTTTTPATTTEDMVQEQVKCVFNNANEVQKCYSDDGMFGCSGLGSCIAGISGEKDKKTTWKSSCEGYAYTTLDGTNEYMDFKCVPQSVTTTPAVTPTAAPAGTPVQTVQELVKEQITCLFQNSGKEQKCYIAEDNSRFYCSGIDSCVIDVSGMKGEKMTWKSSCGGYAYSFLDGNSEYIKFNCIPEGNITITAITGKGFRYAYWQCYDGEEQKHNDPSSCKSSETWQSYAKEFCQDNCYSDKSKCGVNSFSVSEECYNDFEKPIANAGGASAEECEGFLKECKLGDNSLCDKWERNCQIKKESNISIGSIICKDSCPLEGKCYPFGYRKSNKFCSDIGSFVEQLEGDKTCDNNFECSSNVCVSGTCVSEGFIQTFMNWFKNLFG